MTATTVTYPAGATQSVGTVVETMDAAGGRTAVVLSETAFHPVDTAWPDQPADRGELVFADGRRVTVVDAVVGARSDGEVFLGPAVPVRTGTDGWEFFVVHLIEEEAPAVGDRVTVTVDAAHRAALSRGHTACHLASLALDEALADAWRKDVMTDARGRPAFDALAIQESRILRDGSRDVYRIGKSLRRKGFAPEALDELEAVTARANSILTAWLSRGGAVRVDVDGPALEDRRAWVCALADGEVRIPCGGTHVDSLAEFAEITVALSVESSPGAVELVMTTTATPV
ncbi:metal-dependent hydrolase [Microbacterium koreense]|uniref:Metal-dependent hydrolase n=1 Tax=Microbacterium koreense TaxID=323761 RepID=A0ABW2ZTS9_9MICO